MRAWFPPTCLLVCLAAAVVPAADPAALFTATPLTAEKAFTAGIEGPGCDAAGNVYAVNLAREGTIGRVTPDGKAEVWVTLPGKSVGNGIVFDRAGTMYVADYVGHNVLKIDPPSRKVSVFAHEPRMNQPNDLAIAADGTLYASDPNWAKGTGQVWKIDRAGTVTLVAANMGTTNGIEVSPDGKTLYVNESVQRNIWAFAIAADGTLSGKRLLTKFADHGFDGMRCDVDGNLYVSRYGKGTVAVVSPAGKVLREVAVLGDAPSNLCFGGPDGRTVYVTEVKKQRLVQFRVDRPGLAWQRWQKSATAEDFTTVKPGTLGVTAFRPTKEKSGFVVGGKNATALIRTLPSLAGRSIADLEKDMRPGGYSTKGFLGKDERLLDILAADNEFVVEKRGLTHQELARHLHLIGALAHTRGAAKPFEFTYHDRRYRVTAKLFRGFAESPFEDGTRTNCEATVENVTNGKKVSYSLLVPHLVERYGFYEGKGTPYRVEPSAVLAVFDFLGAKK